MCLAWVQLAKMSQLKAKRLQAFKAVEFDKAYQLSKSLLSRVPLLWNLLSKWVEIDYVYNQIAGNTHKATHGLLAVKVADKLNLGSQRWALRTLALKTFSGRVTNLW